MHNYTSHMSFSSCCFDEGLEVTLPTTNVCEVSCVVKTTACGVSACCVNILFVLLSYFEASSAWDQSGRIKYTIFINLCTRNCPFGSRLSDVITLACNYCHFHLSFAQSLAFHNFLWSHSLLHSTVNPAIPL